MLVRKGILIGSTVQDALRSEILLLSLNDRTPKGG
jgi:hypothetical protein